MKVFPEDLLYSREHIWVRVDGDMATLGITDYAQESLGEILSIEFPEIDTYVERDEAFGSIESTKAVVDLIASVSGTIVSVNEDIHDDIGIINIVDVSTFVEILNNKGEMVFQALQTTPVKGRLRKVSKAE